MGLEIIGLMTVIGGALAVLLTGFAVYSHISRKERELAVIKALGVPNWQIAGGVLVQSAWVAVLGFLLAVVLMLMAGQFTSIFVPQVTLEITTRALSWVGVGALFVTFLATLIPLRRVMRVEPATAFHA